MHLCKLGENANLVSDSSSPRGQSIIPSHHCTVSHLLGIFLQETRKKKYCKIPNISDTRKFAVITLKVEQDGLSLE